MFTQFYRNRQLLILTLTLILVWGLTSFFSLPRLEDPEIVQRTATVTTRFPGATAERVEAVVTEPIEEELAEIEEIETLESVSAQGISTITIFLKDTVEAVDPVWALVRSRIDDVAPLLPEEALEPEYEDLAVRANALIIGLTWELDTPVNYALLRRWTETLEGEVRSFPGTNHVELFGSPEEEIRVEVRPADLATVALTPQEVSEQIRASNAQTSAGQLRSPDRNLSFEIADELGSLASIGNVPIQTGLAGEIVRLADIAQVTRGIVEPANSLAFVAGKPAIVLAVTVDSGLQVDRWAVSARQLLSEFARQLPNGIGLHTLLDQSRYVQTRINGVLQELFLGSLLAMAVILVMMGWRSAIVVSAALPLSTLLVFGWMRVLGVPLHQTSMTGLIIAIGLLIDNAIVMADEMQHRLHQDMPPEAAIADSVQQMWLPLLSSTVTTVLAFLPIAVSPGGVGEFIGTIGISGILGLVSSLFISMTLLPALSGWLHHWRWNRRTPAWLERGFSHPQLTQTYRWTLDRALSRPLLTVSLSLVLPIAGWVMVPHLSQQFFPPTGRDQFYLEFELPSQSALNQTQTQILEVRDVVLKHPEVQDLHWFLGESAPVFYYNMLGSRQNAANYAQGIVQLRSDAMARPVIQALQHELDQAFPDAQILVRQLEQGPPFDAPIELRLSGSDLSQLQQIGNQMRTELAQIQNVVHTRATLTEVRPKLAVQVDEEQARLVGLDRTAIAQQLDTILEGITAGSVLEATEELPIRVRLSNADRSDLNQIASLDLLPIRSSLQNRQTIPLSSIGKIQLVPEFSTIRRRNGQRMNVVQAFLTAGALPSEALGKFQNRLQTQNLSLPTGYSFEFGGEAEERSTAITQLLSTVSVLLILMTATLVLTFNSFALAASIGLIAILSAGFGIAALGISGYPFGFTAILGTIGLIGIAVNESTVVIAALQADRQASLGDRKGVREVVVQATRHLLATTITDMVGFTPLLFDPTGFWNPLAIVIAGGLGGVAFLSLYFTPSIYLLIGRRKTALGDRS